MLMKLCLANGVVPLKVQMYNKHTSHAWDNEQSTFFLFKYKTLTCGFKANLVVTHGED